MRIAFLALMLILLQSATMAQSMHRKKNRDVFPTYGNYDRKGWIISPLFTYTLRPFRNATEQLPINDAQYYDVEYSAVGRIGLGIEGGRFYVLDSSPIINYFDFTLGFKNLRGVERFTATVVDSNGASSNVVSGDGVFGQNFITLSLNAHKINQVSDVSFIQNSLGVNADYRISETYTYNDRGLPIELASTNPIFAQLHYRFGMGFKISPNVIIVPSIETPILTLYEFDNFKSTLSVFNSRYRPIIGRVSILLHDSKKDRQCPDKGGRKRGKPETLFGKK
jgi:hypothetical protein